MIARSITVRLLVLLALLTPATSFALVFPPPNVRVIDAPNDAGAALTVIWAPIPGEGPDLRYQVVVRPVAAPDDPKVVAEFPGNTHY
jgi:hypothetical protein